MATLPSSVNPLGCALEVAALTGQCRAEIQHVQVNGHILRGCGRMGEGKVAMEIRF
jgi:hypothetical protein